MLSLVFFSGHEFVGFQFFYAFKFFPRRFIFHAQGLHLVGILQFFSRNGGDGLPGAHCHTFGEGHARVGEGLCLGLVVAGHLTLTVVEVRDIQQRVLLVERFVNAPVAPHGEGLAGVDIAVQADGCLLAGGYRVDCEFRAGEAVAADENVGLCGLIGEGIRDGGAFFRGFERTDIERAPVDDLADGRNDGVDLYCLELALATLVSFI